MSTPDNELPAVDSTATVNSVRSLISIIDELDKDIHINDERILSLEDSRRDLEHKMAVNPKFYKYQKNWPQEVKDKFVEYKGSQDSVGPTRRNFDNLKNPQTPEEHLEKAQLAIKWGQAALGEADGRISFMEKYKNAYKFHANNTHLEAAKDILKSAKKAMKQANLHYDRIWKSFCATANPRIFSS